MRSRRWFGRIASVLGALLIWSLTGSQALASVAACYRLADVISPADFKIAYNFVTKHGQCISNFDDPAFDAVAVGLTGLQISGAINAGTCTTLLNDVNSQAVKTLQQAVPDLDIVSEYLDCGCAVAESGIADRIKSIIADMRSCASAFDPSGVIESGLNKAGTALGFSTLWGLESNAHDPRAGVGNGGAPTTAYTTLPTCQVGVSLVGQKYGDGHYYPSCACPTPTTTLTNGTYQRWSAPLAGQTFSCVAPCDPGQAVQNGLCRPCPSLGPNSANVPNPSRTKCVQSGTGTVTVTNPCQKPEMERRHGRGQRLLQRRSEDRHLPRARPVSGHLSGLPDLQGRTVRQQMHAGSDMAGRDLSAVSGQQTGQRL